MEENTSVNFILSQLPKGTREFSSCGEIWENATKYKPQKYPRQ